MKTKRFVFCEEIFAGYYENRGPGSSVGIATGYGLNGPGIESRGEARFSAPVQTGSGAHPASYTTGTGSFPVVKSGRGVTLTPHPLLVPWARKSRAIHLLLLWAVRSVQSFSACTRVHFTFTFSFTMRIKSKGQIHWVKNRQSFLTARRTAVAQWLRCCAIYRKVAGSIPDGVTGIFHWHIPPDRTIVLRSTQPLTEMSTRNISCG